MKTLIKSLKWIKSISLIKLLIALFSLAVLTMLFIALAWFYGKTKLAANLLGIDGCLWLIVNRLGLYIDLKWLAFDKQRELIPLADLFKKQKGVI